MLRHKLMAPDGDGNDGGGGGDNEPSIKDLAASVSTLTEHLKVLAGSHQELGTGMKAITERLGELDALKEAINRGPEEKKKTDVDLPDDELEGLSRRELINLIAAKMGNEIEARIKPLQAGVEKAFNRMDEKEALEAVREMKGNKDTPDFLEWKQEIGGLLKEDPNLSIRRAYAIARAENPDKAKKIDAKYAPKTNGNGEGFTGGFFPTSSRTSSSTKMAPKQAAEAAWQSVMTAMGGDAESVINTH